MKKLMVSVAAVLLAGSLFAQEKNYIDQPYIEVTGKAEMEVVPDEIYLRIVINEKDNKGIGRPAGKRDVQTTQGNRHRPRKEPRRTRYVQRSANLLPA